MWARRCICINARAGLLERSCARYPRDSFPVSRWVASSAATPTALASRLPLTLKGRFTAPRVQISTLSPKKLTDTEALDVSGKTKARINTAFGAARVHYHHAGDSRFPPGTRGFLYFTSPPAAPSIRFRIVDGCDPAEFNNGRDLLLPDDVRPWNVSEKIFLKAHAAVPLRRLLVHEELLGFSAGATAQWPRSFDPARLTPIDAVTLSGLDPSLDLAHGRVRLRYTGDKKTSFASARGFLYFDTTSLSVRFRVVGDSEMEFGPGSDLLLPDERTPWCIPFHRVVSSAAYTPIREQLLIDNLISERQIQSRAYVVSTLDRTRLTDADRMDLSGFTGATISVASPGREPFDLPVQYSPTARFPSSARGFLYWHASQEDRYEAELRFRCVESPERFAQGRDLLTPGLYQPWSNRLRSLARQSAPSSAPLLASQASGSHGRLCR
ncbi:hypothetical protein BD626DRAFT_176419 [Schizophyllum amplum]|uniref:Uncharacterized protein n=1 Tax=Schizophyllum amplum TaxID=97359 RepID=A0A550C2A9_9AGAR|nr:hypothetical protein BD626DRAFT_176419 [Auriculariopsis ampla]